MPGSFFQTIAQQFDANLMAGVSGIIDNGLAWARPQVRAGATLFVLITGYLVLVGKLDRHVLASRVVRIVAVAALLTSAGTFNAVVRDLFLETIPTSVGSALTGSPTGTGQAAAQFDAIWNATQRAAAVVLAEATGWTQVGERVAIRLLMAATFVPLVVIFLIWIVCRVVMGLVIALGPFLLGLWLFDATRPYVQRWVGKLVSLTLVQVSAAVLLQLLVAGFTTYLRSVQGNMGAGLDEKIASFLQVAGWYWCGLLLMAGLSVVAYSIGGGLATSFTAVGAGAAQQADAAAAALRAGGGHLAARAAALRGGPPPR